MKKLIIFLLSIVLFASTLLGCANKKPTQVVSNDKICVLKKGVSDYKIVVPQNATEAEQYAAEEMQDFFNKATDYKLPIESDSGKTFNDASKIISVGNTSLKTQADVKTDFLKLDTDGFVTEVKNNVVFLSGASDRGTLYSVYDFLERFVGVRYLSVDETFIPKVTDVYVNDERKESVPAFKRRDAHFYNTINNPDFSARLRLNGIRTDLTAKHGYGSKEEWSKDWAHTLYLLLPPSKYYDAHPEWYGNVPKEDVEKDGNKKMCFNNDELRSELVKNLKQLIIDQPTVKYFAVAQEDNSTPCKCAECQKSDAKYTFTGSILKFVNQVAREIGDWQKKEMPNREILIEAFAYQQTEIPPVKLNENGKYELISPDLEIPDNVVIRIAPIWSCFSHDLLDENCSDNAKSKMIFEGWGAICDKIIMWTYGNNFTNYVMYFNNFNTIAGNYQTFVKNNVVEILDQGAFDTPRTNFQELRIYVESKLMWDPYQNTNDIIEEFCKLYYGIAGQDMLDFMELFSLHYASLNDESYLHMWCWDKYEELYSASNYPKRFLEQNLSIFDNAYKKINSLENSEERNKLNERVTALSLIPRYYVMINYVTYYDESTKKDFVDKWFDDAASVGLTRFYEGFPLTGLYDQIMGK